MRKTELGARWLMGLLPGAGVAALLLLHG
jgi:hypothetical protein